MAVVIAFFVCWAPYQAQRLLFVCVSKYGEWTPLLRDINQSLFYIAGKKHNACFVTSYGLNEKVIFFVMRCIHKIYILLLKFCCCGSGFTDKHII